MDNLTHVLTGVFLSRAGFNRVTPKATLLLILAANAPDVDIVTALGGSLNYLHWHRHITHSLIAAPVLALIAVAIVRILDRSVARTGRLKTWLIAWLVAMVGVASHLLLDLTNVYGIRLLLPFSGEWFHLDLTAVVDIWIWSFLLLCLVAPWLGRLVSSEIGARSTQPPGRGFAIAALLFLTLINLGHKVLHDRATAVLDSRIYNGASPTRVAAFPGPSNPLHWHGLAETHDSVSVFDVDLLASFDPAAGRIFYKPEDHPALALARRSDTFQEFLRFSLYPFWRIVPSSQGEGYWRVDVMDLRFGSPPDPSFVATAIVDPRGRVGNEGFTFGSAPPR